MKFNFKKSAFALLMGVAAASAPAQVANCAIELQPGGSVTCGPICELNGKKSYSVQFWMAPAQWTEGSVIYSRGDAFSAKLGTPGSVVFNSGASQITATHAALEAGKWAQLTLMVNEGLATVLVNGESAGNGVLDAIPVADGMEFTIGGGTFSGRVDELRLWQANLTTSYFDYFINNTINKHNPQWDDLVAYYKMDMDGCPNLVDYKGIETPQQRFTNHGVMSDTGVKRVKVDDNNGLRYIINSAYTANERFFDRAIPVEQYRLSNDLIILGIQSLSDGHLKLCTPNHHLEKVEGATWLAEFEGRKGVVSLDGNGKLTAPVGVLAPNSTDLYTFEVWVYVDQWVPGSYIVRKTNSDLSKGFALRLGDEEKNVELWMNGNKYVFVEKTMVVGSWVHVAVTPYGKSSIADNFSLYLNGSAKSAKKDLSSVTDYSMIPDGVDDVQLTLGEGFKGKLDNVIVWNYKFDRNAITGHMNNPPFVPVVPNLGSYQYQRCDAFWAFDKKDNPGYSWHSQDEWLALMKIPYEGYRGYQIRISVKSHNGWQTTISNAENRKRFAADLAVLSEPYDGVELDLEWMDGKQTALGLLAREIRAALPEGKSFFISCHQYGAYQFPHEDMQYVDGFTFQQYGPQKTHFLWNTFKNGCTNFINYGFERGKIMTSYATTTSKGFGSGADTPIKGVRDGFLEGDYEPNDSEEYGEAGGYNYWFTGPTQTYRRAKYTMDEGLQGIFYWDMGNDVPVEHKYNLAKWASYGVNANLDRDITEVDIRRGDNTGVGSVTVAAPRLVARANGDILTVGISDGTPVELLEIFTPSGVMVMQVENPGQEVVITALSSGIYLMRAVANDGAAYSAKITKH